MAGDRSGSYFLEAAIECSGWVRVHRLHSILIIPLTGGLAIIRFDFLESLWNLEFKQSVGEYSLDSSANYLVQALLLRLAAEIRLSNGRPDAAASRVVS